ncbi:MAG: anthranilate phosphoribosyltransferase [Melioribacter sp.]|uniref:anthranilate phosphoribosyltransferase n=1 Tax=Rosettibacter primus TaxID=3111523 RepID=UPI00247DE430|nr:anthranilate phosphoribosyltransferase [Melioribacter sp.]
MINNYIEKIASGINLTIDEAYESMTHIMNGSCNNSQIAGFLLALKTKGETPEEVAGFIKAMRNKSIKINSDENTIDVCGTGGDGSNTFNISTASAFVVAGCGIKVAKHGNKSISSKCGSADVLSYLGININLSPSAAEEALNKIGITFLFAPLYHPAMKYAAEVRKELGMRTVFNILGPLTNPANTKKQLIGTFNNQAAELMSKAVSYLDMQKVCFVCTDNSLDEISLTEETDVFEHHKSTLKKYKISYNTFGYKKIDKENIQSNSVEKNAEIILSVLRDKVKNDAFYVVAANAAMALYAADYSNNINECRLAAEESILSGRAYEKLISLKSFGENYQ